MNPLVTLAKSAVEGFVKEGKVVSFFGNLPKEFLNKKSGAFVTIEASGNLRGCIGTYLPTKENIAKEVIQNAIAAAAEDYRFGPIQKEELPCLAYTVYILSEPELVKDISGLDPKKYGIIVKTTPIISPRPIGRGSPLTTSEAADRTNVVFNGKAPLKSGLLLPGLEGINAPEEQIAIACQKGGIDPAIENVIIYRFGAEKYGEKN